MKAEEKFNARLKELGLFEEWLNDNDNKVGIDTGEEIIILYYSEDEYSELHFPPFGCLRMNDKFVKQCKNVFYCDESYEFVSKLANWLEFGKCNCPLFPVDAFYCACGLETKIIEFKDDEPELSEEEYQNKIAEGRGTIDVIRKTLDVFRSEIIELIRMKFNQGHNIPSDFGIANLFDIKELGEFYISNHKTAIIQPCEHLYIEASNNAESFCIVLNRKDFPIEVLIEIYKQMK